MARLTVLLFLSVHALRRQKKYPDNCASRDSDLAKLSDIRDPSNFATKNSQCSRGLAERPEFPSNSEKRTFSSYFKLCQDSKIDKASLSLEI